MATFATDVGMPFRFSDECDLFLDDDYTLIDQAMNIIAFTPTKTVPLNNSYGCSAASSIFDQLDTVTELELDESLRTSFESLEPRVVLDKQFVYDQSPDELKLIVIVPYRVIITGQATTARLTVGRTAG